MIGHFTDRGHPNPYTKIILKLKINKQLRDLTYPHTNKLLNGYVMLFVLK